MSGGKGGSVTVGYKYYLGIHMALCHGPIDKITQIQVDRRIAWEGLADGGPITIDAPDLFGGDGREGGVSGTVDIEMGGPDQTPNSYLSSVLGTDMPAFKGVTCAVLNQVYTGNNPYLKPWSFTAQRIHVRMDGQEQWYDSYSEITRPGSVGVAVSPECLPYACDAFQNEIILQDATLWPLDDMNLTATVPADGILRKLGNLIPANYVTDSSSWNGSWAPGGTVAIDTRTVSDNIGYCRDNFLYLAKKPTGAWLSSVDEHPSNVDGTGDTQTDVGAYIVREYSTGQSTVIYAADYFVYTFLGVGDPQTADPLTLTINIDDATGSYLITMDGKTKSGTITQDLTGGFWVHAKYSRDFGNISGTQLPYTMVCELYINGVLEDTLTESFQRANIKNTESYGVAASYAANDVPGFATPSQLYIANGNIAGADLYSGTDMDVPALKVAWDRNHALYAVPAGCACADMNPAHIIRECLTDPDWGMGYADADIDDTAFQSAAQALFDENMGISLLWEREMPLEDFIAEILRHIDAVLYVDRTTGQFVLSLIRGDYTESNLLLLDETNTSQVKDARRPTVGELTSSITVNYWDGSTGETGSVTQHNQALIQVQGAVKHTTIQYPGFTHNEIAQRVAIRDLTALSTSLLSCSITANREASTLNIGDAFILDWPDLGINSQVMRVQQLGLGDGRDNAIKIDAVEDVFTTPAYLALGDGDVDNPWVDPTTLIPAAAAPRLVTEAPYYQLVLQSGETQINSIIEDDLDAGFLLTAGGRQGGELNARLHVDSGAGYDQFAYLDFAPYAYLSSPIGETDTQIYLTGGDDLDDVEGGSIAQIGDELIRVDSLTEDSSGTFIMVGRGVLDTVPAAHGSDSVGLDSNSDNNRSDAVIFWGGSAASDNVQYTASDSIDVKMQTVLGSNVYPFDTTPVDSVTMSSRAYRPYPPGRLAIDGESYPEANSSSEIYWTGAHEISWTHRDRLQQTDGNLYDYTEGNIGPEGGTTYRIDIYSTLQNGTVTAPWWTVDGLSTTSYAMDSNTDTSRGEPAPETDLVHIKVTSVRDGYESWQSPIATLSYVSDSVGDSIGIGVLDSVGVVDSVGDSNHADPYWGSVVALTHFETDATDDTGRTTTLQGSAAVVTGSGLLVGDGYLSCTVSGDRITYDNTDNAFDFGTGDFTIEFTYRPTNVSTTAWMCRGDGSVWMYRDNGQNDYLKTNALSTTFSVFAGVNYNIAISRTAGTTYVFVDGVLRGSAADATNYVSSTDFAFGGHPSTPTTNWGPSSIDEIRVTKGVGRYTSNYTVDVPFP